MNHISTLRPPDKNIAHWVDHLPVTQQKALSISLYMWFYKFDLESVWEPMFVNLQIQNNNTSVDCKKRRNLKMYYMKETFLSVWRGVAKESYIGGTFSCESSSPERVFHGS